jgi:thiamine pyrophosphokinase
MGSSGRFRAEGRRVEYRGACAAGQAFGADLAQGDAAVSVLFTSTRPALLVGGAPLDPATLNAVQGRYGAIVAADGGADQLAAHGLHPDAIIGDLDSLRVPDGWGDVPVHRVAEQDSTDFEKCLRHVEAPLFFAVGFDGARIDHGLAVASALAQSPRRVILVGGGDLCCRLGAGIALDLAPGTRVSLFPMGPATGRSTGLRWEIDGLEMAPAGRIGTSNQATGPVSISVKGGPMLLIVPVNCLDELIAGMEDRDA